MSLRAQLAKALLSSEKALRTSLESSAHRHLGNVATTVYASPYRTQATILRASAQHSRMFEQDARVIIIDGRKRARDTSLLLTGGLFAGLALGSADDLDEARSDLAARGLAQRFAGISVASFGAWLLSGKPSPSSALVLARRRIPSAVELTGSTENAHAFSDTFERIAANRNALGYLVEFEWDASHDSRTCSVCSSMNGEVTEGGVFRNGLWPGSVHPRCRCFAFPTTITMRQAERLARSA